MYEVVVDRMRDGLLREAGGGEEREEKGERPHVPNVVPQ
jgi:hypothetical protein